MIEEYMTALKVTQAYSATLEHPFLAYRCRIPDRLSCDSAVLKDLPILFWQSSAIKFLCVLLVQFKNILSAVYTRTVSCPVDIFVTFEANSIWRFFKIHHLLWSRLRLPEADVPHCHEKPYVIKTS